MPKKAKKGSPNWSEVNALIKKWQPDIIVVGIPLNMDGTTQKTTKQAKYLMHEIERRTKIKTAPVDERLTTRAAKEEIFEQHGFKGLTGDNINSTSAKIIVEQWFAENL